MKNFDTHQDARNYYEKAIELNPNDSEAHCSLGICLQDHFNEFNDARKHLNKAVEVNPLSAKYHNNLGVCIENHFMEYQIARQCYEKAIEIDPEFAIAHDHLGYCLGRYFNEHQKARKCHEKAIELDPKCAIAFDHLGFCLEKFFSEHHKAKLSLERAIEIDPTLANAHNNLGACLEAHFGEYQRARECYEKAIEIDPTFAIAYDNLGFCLEAYFGEYQKAREHYQKAIEIDPEYVDAYDHLGFCLSTYFSESHKAKECYEKVIETDPKYAITWVNMGFLLLDHPELNSEFSVASCFQRGIYENAILTIENALFIYSYLNNPILTQRWIESLCLPPFFIELPQLSQLIRTIRGAIALVGSLSNQLSEGAIYDRICLLHLFGDTAYQLDEAIKYTKKIKNRCSTFALAHSLAIELLEFDLAEQLLKEILPTCRNLADRTITDPSQLISACVLLQHSGELEKAYSCAELAQQLSDENMAHAALWLTWHIAHLQNNENAQQLAEQVKKADLQRFKTGKLCFLVTLTIEDLSDSWSDSKDMVRHMILQEYISLAVLDFIDQHEEALDGVASAEEWEKWGDLSNAIVYRPEKMIQSYKNDQAVATILDTLPSSDMSSLIKHLAGQIQITTLISKGDVSKWIKVLYCLIHENRLDPDRQDTANLFLYLFSKHHFDVGGHRLNIAMITVPGMMLWLVDASGLVTSIFTALSGLIEKKRSISSSFPSYIDFLALGQDTKTLNNLVKLDNNKMSHKHDSSNN